MANSPPGKHASPDDILDILNRQYPLEDLKHVRDFLGGEAVARYQRLDLEGALQQPINRAVLDQYDRDWAVAAAPGPPPGPALMWRFTGHAPGQFPLRRGTDGSVYFADYDWFCYFTAVGLASAIRAGNLEAIDRRVYPNYVHQCLAGYVRREQMSNLSEPLRQWLTDHNGVSRGRAIVRNFAAYVIGMLGLADAEDDLATTMDKDRSEEVVMYCITSLGKLRSRRHLPRLVQRFEQERGSTLKLLISQAVSNIVGVARYPL
jgi:hypothetical protein